MIPRRCGRKCLSQLIANPLVYRGPPALIPAAHFFSAYQSGNIRNPSTDPGGFIQGSPISGTNGPQIATINPPPGSDFAPASLWDYRGEKERAAVTPRLDRHRTTLIPNDSIGPVPSRTVLRNRIRDNFCINSLKTPLPGRALPPCCAGRSRHPGRSLPNRSEDDVFPVSLFSLEGVAPCFPTFGVCS